MSVVLALNSNRIESEQRVTGAMQFAVAKNVATVAMVGGDAQGMCDYAASHFRVGPTLIPEDNSKDTIEGAHFIKLDLLQPNGWNDIDIFTNEYHAPRVSWIFGNVLGDGYSIRTHAVESTHLSPKQLRTLEYREKAQLAVAKLKLVGLCADDDEQRANRLALLRFRDRDAPLARFFAYLDKRTNVPRG